MNWYAAEAEVAHRQAGRIRDAERIRAGRAARLRKARRQVARIIRFEGRTGGPGSQAGDNDVEASAMVRHLAA